MCNYSNICFLLSSFAIIGQRHEQVHPHQEQDLWVPHESQRGGELPAGAAAVTICNDVPVVVELQLLQEVRHHL